MKTLQFATSNSLKLYLIIALLFQAGLYAQNMDMMVRIAEIEIDSNQLENYKNILREEAEASVRLEPGVISIYPMYPRENPTKIQILEIYANREAYELHLKTPHFLKYKSSTLDMVKSLKLIDMEAIDEETMPNIFYKLNNKQ